MTMLFLLLMAAAGCGDDAMAGDAAPPGDAGRDAGLPADGGSDAATDSGSDGGGPADGGDATAYLDDCFAGLERFSPSSFLQVQTFESAAEGIALRIGRDNEDGFGTSGTIPFVLERFAIVTPTERQCVTERASLRSDVSHHNFDDSVEGSAGATRFVVHMTFDLDTGDPIDELTIHDGGAVRLGPIPLAHLSCVTDPSDRPCYPLRP